MATTIPKKHRNMPRRRRYYAAKIGSAHQIVHKLRAPTMRKLTQKKRLKFNFRKKADCQ
jgi:hypothetical protein